MREPLILNYYRFSATPPNAPSPNPSMLARTGSIVSCDRWKPA
ncbi:MAG: hypothetical protein U0744_07430 [Gemmataceae bacterium]